MTMDQLITMTMKVESNHHDIENVVLGIILFSLSQLLLSNVQRNDDIFIFRAQDLGAREQPVGAYSVFQHSELMVNI